MYIARKNASTVDERSRGIDSQDPFVASEVPVAGAIVNPLVGSVTRMATDSAVAQLNTNSVGYGAFGGNDLTDHYKFTAQPGVTYTVIVSTDSSNGNIRTEAYADYFDLYFEDNAGTRMTADFQIKELDLRTKMVEFTVPATAAANSTYYVQIDNAFEQPFEYAIALFDKSKTPEISVDSVKNTDGTHLVTFRSNVELSTSRPRVDRIEVQGGTLGAMVRGSDGKSYSVLVTPAADSQVDLSVRALTGAFFSRSGDPNVDGDQANNGKVLQAFVPPKPPADTTKPSVVSIASEVALQEGDTVTTLIIELSEEVAEFTVADLTVTGGTISEFSGTGKRYSATLTLDASNTTGAVQISVGTAYADLAGNAGQAFAGTLQFKLKPVDPPVDPGEGGDPIPDGLSANPEATVDPLDTQTLQLGVKHSDAAAPVTVYLNDGIRLVPIADADVAANLGKLRLQPQFEVVTGELAVTDGLIDADGALNLAAGQRALPLNLVLVLGTDPVNGGATGADSLSVATDLPNALYGFGGDDSLIESANTVVLNGGDGVDRYELTPAEGVTIVEDTGSPVTLDIIFGVFGLLPAYFGFDLITGFDIGTDTFRFTGKTFADHKTVVGVFDSLTQNFTPDAMGTDLMVFLDVEAAGNTADQIDDGEPAVVIVGAAQAANTPAIGGNGD